MPGIGGERHQRLAHRPEQQTRHGGGVETPQRQQFMGDGEDQVMMGAIEQAGPLPFQPLLGADLVTLGAAAVLTGVVPDAVQVTLVTALDVAAEHGRPAGGNLPGRPPVMGRQPRLLG